MTRELGLAIQTDKSAEDYVAIARAAEDGGFDVLSAYGDLGFQPPIVPLTLVAQATRRIRLGPACLNPYTLHPVEIAAQIAALDAVAGGRAYLGLAKGAWLETIGIEQRRPLARLREAVETIRARGVRVPLLIGSWGARTLRWAGEVADEVKIGGSANPELVPLVRERVANDRVRIVFGAVTVVDEDGDAARARAHEEVRMYLDVVGRLDPTARGVEAFVLAGTPEEVARQAGRLLDAGVRRIDFGTPHGLTWQRGIELLATRVLPALR